MIKLCIWMNIPSHYQTAFFTALYSREDVDLCVAYLQGPSRTRSAEGWKDQHHCRPYEYNADGKPDLVGFLKTIPDWEERTHVISSYFSSSLIDFFCAHKIKWCHWSEMPGVRLADQLDYRMTLFRWLYPLMLMMKHKDGARIRKYATGAFGQGVLARRAFTRMGVPSRMTEDLFYTPAALATETPSEAIVSFAKGRKVFLAVGALCKRKGCDVLLKAFAQSAHGDAWCLVLCGLDKENGRYQALAEQLGIVDHVLFLGAYPADRIAEVYAAADVFVLASRFDGWGAVLNEAASMELPLLATDLCGGAHHLIHEGINGFCVKAGSASSLAKGLHQYMNAPDIIEPQGAASKVLFNEQFTPDKNAERLVRVLQQWGIDAG